MNTDTQNELFELIRLFKTSNPELHPRTMEQYYQDLENAFKNIPNDIIVSAIFVCKEKKYWEFKHLNYFRGIVLSKQKEYDKQKENEEKKLTPLPGKVVWGK